MIDLDRLFEAASHAPTGERIEFRDSIAAYGASAIPQLSEWLESARRGAFAVRTLERIGRDAGHRPAVLNRSANPESLPMEVERDRADAIERLGGRAARTGVDAWPGSREVSALELRFHQVMLDIFTLAGEATRRRRSDGTTVRGYWASYFLRGVRNHGGPEYAHQLLRKEGISDGFRRLMEESRLDLSVEALVLKPEYISMFTEDERRIAAHRLAEAGYVGQSS